MVENLKGLQQCIERRKELMANLFDAKTLCFRLATEAEIGFDIDVFGLIESNQSQWCLFLYLKKVQQQKIYENFKPYLEMIEAALGGKVLAMGGALKKEDRSVPLAPRYFGASEQDDLITMELGRKYKIEIKEMLNPGLFMDQRENRVFLARYIYNNNLKTGFNFFSYTGAFSLMGTSLGCQMTSVDLSKHYLTWEGQNQELNGMGSLSKRIAEDAGLYLERKHRALETKKEPLCDFIILDPPTFSRNGNKIFKVQQQLPHLTELACDLISEKGFVFASCNDQRWHLSDFKKTMNQIAKSKKLKAHFCGAGPDFLAHQKDPAYPLKGVVLFRSL